jgi:tetratricopeptide (TPR) repeat protein
MRYRRHIAFILLGLLIASFLPLGALAAQGGSEQLPLDWSAPTPDRELNSKAQVFVDRGNAAYRARNFVIAVLNYSELIKLKPNDPRAHYNRGNAYFKLNDLMHALDDFSQVVALDPTFYLAFMNRGNIYSRQGHYNEAIADYDRAIALKPDDSLIFYNRGVARRILGQLDEALRDFTKAVELNQNDAQSYAERGLVLLEKKLLDTAQSDLLLARKLDPENARAAKGLEMLRERMRQPDLSTSSTLGLVQRQQILNDLYELAEATCFANGEEPSKLRDIAIQKNWTAQDANKLAQASSPDAQVISGWIATTSFGEIAVIQSELKVSQPAFTCSITAKVNQIGNLDEAQSEFSKRFAAATVATEFQKSSSAARYWLPHNSKCDVITAIEIAPENSMLTIRMLHGRLRGEGI